MGRQELDEDLAREIGRTAAEPLARVMFASPLDLNTSPEAQHLLALPGDVLVGATLLLLSSTWTPGPLSTASTIATAQDTGRWDARVAAMLLGRLRRRRLPWSTTTAALALRLVTDPSAPVDHDRASVALSIGTSVAKPGGAGSELRDAALALEERLGDAPPWQYGVTDLRVRARRLAAACTPRDVVGLGFVSSADDWGEGALEVFRRHATGWDHAPELVRLLATGGGQRETQAWRRATRELVEAEAPARRIIIDWLRALPRLPEPEPAPIGVATKLLAPENEQLVRAAIRAATWIDEDVDDLLVDLVHLGARVTGPHEPLALPMATAAIDVLADRTDAHGDRLVRLLGELDRVDLLRRVGRQRPSLRSAAEARATTVAETKRRQSRSRRRPAPPRRSELDDAVREVLLAVLAPGLHRLGFTGDGPAYFVLDDPVHWAILMVHRPVDMFATEVQLTATALVVARDEWSRMRDAGRVGARPVGRMAYGPPVWQRDVAELVPGGGSLATPVASPGDAERVVLELLNDVEVHVLPAMHAAMR